MRLTYQELTAVVTLLEQEEEKLRKAREEAHATLKRANDAFEEWANENAPVPDEAKKIHTKTTAPLVDKYERALDRYYTVKSALAKITDTSYEL